MPEMHYSMPEENGLHHIKTKLLQLPQADASAVLTAQMLLDELPDDAARQAVSNEAAAKARHACGEGASDEALAAEWGRQAAALCCERQQKKANAAFASALHLPTNPFLFGIALAALLIGALADQWTSNGRLINLLAFPFLGLLLWNTAVYILLLISFISKRFRSAHRANWLREAVSRVVCLLGATRLSLSRRTASAPAVSKSRLVKEASARQHELSALAAASLHLAAGMLAVGLVASILVRGIGTAYAVGWESTWFADSPDAVAAILSALYGWLPLPPSLDLSSAAVKALQLSADGSAAAASSAAASAWLARLIEALLVFIALPRLLLCLASLIHLRQAAKHWDIAFPAELLERLRRSSSSVRWLLLAQKAEFSPALATLATQALNCDAESLQHEDFSLWHADAGLPTIAPDCRVALWQRIDETPEDDVHGQALIQLRKASASPILMLLDCRNASARFGSSSPRIRERLALWQDFANRCGAESLSIGGKA